MVRPLLLLLSNVVIIEKRITIFNLFLFTLILAFFVFVILMIVEVRERYRARKRFVTLAERAIPTGAGARAFPRITIPDTLNVNMSVTSPGGVAVKARLINISTAGFCIRYESGLDWLKVEESLFDVLLHSAINQFVVKELKPIWVVEEKKGRLLGLQIVSIEERQLQLMNDFIYYLKEFLLHVI